MAPLLSPGFPMLLMLERRRELYPILQRRLQDWARSEKRREVSSA